MTDGINIYPIEQRLPESHCPRCNALLDGATGVDDSPSMAKPKPGDVTLCLYCGEFLRYEGDLTLRKSTYEELRELERDPRLASLFAFATRLAFAWRMNKRKEKHGRN